MVLRWANRKGRTKLIATGTLSISLLWKSHLQISRVIATELNLEKGGVVERNLMDGSIAPDKLGGYWHHIRIVERILSNLVTSRKRFLVGNDDWSYYLGVALHYIADWWVVYGSKSPYHSQWERSISAQHIIKDDRRLLSTIPMGKTQLAKAYSQLLMGASRIPSSPMELNEYLLMPRPMQESVPILDLNVAYRLCLGAALCVTSSKYPPEELKRAGRFVESYRQLGSLTTENPPDSLAMSFYSQAAVEDKARADVRSGEMALDRAVFQAVPTLMRLRMKWITDVLVLAASSLLLLPSGLIAVVILLPSILLVYAVGLSATRNITGATADRTVLAFKLAYCMSLLPTLASLYLAIQKGDPLSLIGIGASFIWLLVVRKYVQALRPMKSHLSMLNAAKNSLTGIQRGFLLVLRTYEVGNVEPVLNWYIWE